MIRLASRVAMVGLALTAASAVAGGPPASAHEARTGGALRFVVGWGDEPAYTGFRNSVQVTITEAGSGAGITDVVDTLKAEVVKGSEKTTVPLVANFRAGSGAPGDYRGWLTPTRPGAYTFRITGTIRGQNVDESFSSSKNTFNDVEDVAGIQFPAKDPTTGQLATRLEREVPRLDAALRAAEDRAGLARSFGLAGLAVGALGLLVAAGALVVARRSGAAGRRGRDTDQRSAPSERSESVSR